MSPLARSRLALAVVALLQGACAVPKKIGDQCALADGGDQTSEEHTLETVLINPGLQAASIDVPNICIPGKPIIERVIACDDVKPTIILPNLPKEYQPILIYRNGDYVHQYGSVTITYWCSQM